MLLTKQFQSFNSSDYETSRIQSNVGNALNAVLQCPILDGNYFEDRALNFSLQWGQNLARIEHGLGRPYRGYIVTRCYNNDTSSLHTNIGNVLSEMTGTGDRAQVLMVGTGGPYPDNLFYINVWVF